MREILKLKLHYEIKQDLEFCKSVEERVGLGLPVAVCHNNNVPVQHNCATVKKSKKKRKNNCPSYVLITVYNTGIIPFQIHSINNLPNYR